MSRGCAELGLLLPTNRESAMSEEKEKRKREPTQEFIDFVAERYKARVKRGNGKGSDVNVCVRAQASPDGSEFVEVLDAKQNALPLEFWKALESLKRREIGGDDKTTTLETCNNKKEQNLGTTKEEEKKTKASNKQENPMHCELNPEGAHAETAKEGEEKEVQPVSAGFQKRQVCETNPYLLSEWPSAIRRRSFAHGMPSPSKRLMGDHICIWFQFGGWEGLGSNCIRIEDNLCLSLGILLHHKLGLPLVALGVLPPQVKHLWAQDGVNDKREYDHASRLMLEHIARSYINLEKRLNDMKIPLFGLFGSRKDLISIFACYARKCKAHIVLTSEVYHPKALHLFKAIGRALPCPLYAIDSDSFVPPRKAQDFDLNDWFEQAQSCYTSEISDCLASFQPNCNLAIQASVYEKPPHEGAADFIPQLIVARWGIVNLKELAYWVASCGANQDSLLAKDVGSLIAKMPYGGSDFDIEDLMWHVRVGTLSPLKLASCVQGCGAAHALLSELKSREQHIHKAFSLRKANATENSSAKTTSVSVRKEYLHCPGDLVKAASIDGTWNILQRRLFEQGKIDSGALGFYVEKLIEWSLYKRDGLDLALSWLQSHLYGGQSAEIFARIRCFDQSIGD